MSGIKKALSGIKRSSQAELNRRTFKKIEALRDKLHTDTHPAEAYEALLKLTKARFNDFKSSTASWELALWHADKHTKEDARKALELIKNITLIPTDDFKRRTGIIEAECLSLLGENTAAALALDELTPQNHHDVMLAKSNLALDFNEKHRLINEVFAQQSLSPIDFDEDGKTKYDQIRAQPPAMVKGPLVSIIVPVYNSANTIVTALRSLMYQSWENIEIIVVDDCSTDNTKKLVMDLQKQDKRIRLITTNVNGGPYIARNLALNQATGMFITTNDGDDWSHPQKIQKQVERLIKNSKLLGNTSQQVRATNDLIFLRRGNRGFYVQVNVSSLMFRRKEVVDSIGYWDSVRFGADSEFLERIQKVHGRNSVEHLSDCLLSFQRWSKDSLTTSDATAFRGYYKGPRLEYKQAYENWHKSQQKNLYMEFPLTKRPFVVPRSMETSDKT